MFRRRRKNNLTRCQVEILPLRPLPILGKPRIFRYVPALFQSKGILLYGLRQEQK